ncbi:hypothetical protein GJ496_003203 [Pomphorhynchus laevis]|nr:hypothetical protein GJ496_003203 [Pomphorhynchus laevis]
MTDVLARFSVQDESIWNHDEYKNAINLLQPKGHDEILNNVRVWVQTNCLYRFSPELTGCFMCSQELSVEME